MLSRQNWTRQIVTRQNVTRQIVTRQNVAEPLSVVIDDLFQFKSLQSNVKIQRGGYIPPLIHSGGVMDCPPIETAYVTEYYLLQCVSSNAPFQTKYNQIKLF